MTSTRVTEMYFKAFALVAAILMAACLSGVPTGQAQAASDSEGLAAGSVTLKTQAQGNNSINNAQYLAANGTVTARLDELGPSHMGVRVYEDWYKVTLPRAGFVQLELSAPYVDKYFANGPWFLELRNSANNLIWYGARPNVNGNYRFLKMGLPAGTYYLSLSSSSVPNVQYTLYAGYASSNYWESEPANDYMNSANALALGSTKYGTVYGCLDMGSNTDRDWYRFTVPSAGSYSIRFGADRATSVNNPWYLVRVYDAWGNSIWDTVSTGDGYVRTVGTLKLKAGTYYLRINGANYLDAHHYELTVNKVATKSNNPLRASGYTTIVKYSKVKKGSVKVKRASAIYVGYAQGPVSYAKVSGNGKIAVSKSGVFTIKKGLKRGTYSVKVKVTAAGNAYYYARSKTVTVKVRVK